MTCCTSDPARAAIGAPELDKHVNYVLGMVLGVDDLNQDFAYASNRVQSVARELIGYGTDRGLAVRVETSEQGPRVRVTPGVAYSPSGEMICVEADQCCLLTTWVQTNARTLHERLGVAATASLPLYVTLCYRTCLTDKVAIPGEPCRDEAALMQPSRVLDNFCLELSLDPPRQREEDAVRDFVRWLRAIPVEDVSPPMPVADFVAAIRTAASPWLDVTASLQESLISDFMFGDPPSGLAIPPTQCAEYLRAAFALWVTELRPVWIARFGCCHAGCARPAEKEDCVLLAKLNVPLLRVSPGDWMVSDVAAVEVDEARRPWLLHVRMLHEWVLAMCACAEKKLPDLGGDLSGPIENARVERIQGVGVVATGASPNHVLTFSAGSWRPQPLPAPPTVTLAGDVAGPVSATRVEKIRGADVANVAPVTDQYLAYNGTAWAPRALPPPASPILLGDVTGAVNATRVEALRNVGIVPVAPADKQVLGFVLSTNKWTPTTIALGGDATGAYHANVVTALHQFPVSPPQSPTDDGKMLVYDKNKWILKTTTEQTGQFVGRGNALGYAIVAAGRFVAKSGSNTPQALVSPLGSGANAEVYGGLKASSADINSDRPAGQSRQGFPYTIPFSFDGFDPKQAYIVKVTLGWGSGDSQPPSDGLTGEFLIYFRHFDTKFFWLRLASLSKSLSSLKESGPLELLVEVSTYERRGGDR